MKLTAGARCLLIGANGSGKYDYLLLSYTHALLYNTNKNIT